MMKGITAQCTAQTQDASIPMRSSALLFAKDMFINKGRSPVFTTKAATGTRSNRSEQSIFLVAPSLSNLSK